MTDATTTADGAAGDAVRVEYVPRPGLGSLSIVNWLLNILTLTLYRFWAKTNVRRHIWSCVHINGQPLEYTGRGSELFKGALFVFFVLLLPSIVVITAVQIAFGPEHPAVFGVQMLLFLIFAVLWGAAIYRARRYQLSRTLWRGIRGALAGSSMQYSLLFFGAMLARAATLGWITPVMNLNLREAMTRNTHFGSMPFRFGGRAGPLYPSYALCWVITLAVIAAIFFLIAAELFIVFGDEIGNAFGDLANEQSEPTEEQSRNILLLVGMVFAGYLALGLAYQIIWAFYTAREMSAFANYTAFDNARFRLNATGGSLIKLAIGNILLWLFTLGIATPFIQQRVIRYLCDRQSVDGTVDIDRILQSKMPVDGTGEGLADAFDIGGI
jgi:uncharacterized membrane protein YjgN (DUF898 family)